MDNALNAILASLGAYLSRVPDALEVLSRTFFTWPGVGFLLFAVLLLSILGTAVFYYDRLRDVSQHLREVSEAIGEQSRAIHTMRRTLEDAMDVLASLEARSHHPVGAQQDMAPNLLMAPSPSTELLRQELESLRAEILSDFERAPPAQE